MSRKYTYDEVKKFVSENSSCVLVSTEYKGVFEKLQFVCACGTEFETDLHHFKTQNQRQCPECGVKKSARSQVKTVEYVNQKLAKFGCKLANDDYRGRKYPVDIVCSCGHIRRMQANNALQPSFSGLCSECSDKKFRGANRFTIEQVRAKCEELGVELVSPEYRAINSPLEFRCSCGRTFLSTFEIVSYYRKTRCDYCTHRMSFGEQRIADWLDEHSVEYVRQKEFPGCGGPKRRYKFDFYVPSTNTCVEFDGQQHFKVVDFGGTGESDKLFETLLDTFDRDRIKTMFCEENGIGLIRIRYDEVDKIPEILSSMLIPR